MVPIVIDTSVRTGGDYGVVASVEKRHRDHRAPLSQVTLWGVPGIRATTRRAAGNAWQAGPTTEAARQQTCPEARRAETNARF